MQLSHLVKDLWVQLEMELRQRPLLAETSKIHAWYLLRVSLRLWCLPRLLESVICEEVPEFQYYLEKLLFRNATQLHEIVQALPHCTPKELNVLVWLHNVGGVLNQIQVVGKNG